LQYHEQLETILFIAQVCKTVKIQMEDCIQRIALFNIFRITFISLMEYKGKITFRLSQNADNDEVGRK